MTWSGRAVGPLPIRLLCCHNRKGTPNACRRVCLYGGTQLHASAQTAALPIQFAGTAQPTALPLIFVTGAFRPFLPPAKKSFRRQFTIAISTISRRLALHSRVVFVGSGCNISHSVSPETPCKQARYDHDLSLHSPCFVACATHCTCGQRAATSPLRLYEAGLRTVQPALLCLLLCTCCPCFAWLSR
jgi:hypothetical protein